MQLGYLARFIGVSLLILGCSPQGDRPDAATDTTTGAPTTVTTPPPLTGTYWRLVALGDRDVAVADTAREPHLTFGPDSARVTGSGGCNRMFGSYTLNGDSMSFVGVGSTKMACASGMDIETAFLPALERVSRWRISGQHLELTDSSGALVARFEGRPPR
ncbi:MAG TPA: META domain-containing protein [Gemmatimonadaceae bacterium]|jgi:heat shock protein HslJ|nr:META domain-containing protein [Gemmatimonadaceae bacterium]